jgi:hypothetical protein
MGEQQEMLPGSGGKNNPLPPVDGRPPPGSNWRKTRYTGFTAGVFQVGLNRAQELYMSKVLGSTSFKHQHHHIFEKWTRIDVLVTTVILGVLGLLELCMVGVWSSKHWAHLSQTSTCFG